MAKKKKRRTRITKQDIKDAREERKITTYQRKKKIIPGPWTDKETMIEVNADLRLNTDSIISDILGPSKGTYTREELWWEKGWYPIVFNIEAENMKEIIATHGMDQFLAASEKALNEKKDSKGKPLYGKIIILNMSVDNSQREDEKRRFISCRGKTNKKNIAGFRAIRKKEYVTL